MFKLTCSQVVLNYSVISLAKNLNIKVTPVTFCYHDYIYCTRTYNLTYKCI